ncbi:MAG TPA: sigma factor-like helix-turn-helix DNA-binding protein [Clostridia bacterium]|nr:sigma factor-like helix-turn-helix DNA-binding protein [Clostridia bacterium]
MEKFAQMGMLLQIYGGLLTDRQKDVMDLYYNYDLSLSEIAEQFGISRQGVYDLIKRAEQILLNADKNIGFLDFRYRILDGIKDIAKDLDDISKWTHDEFKENPSKVKEGLNNIKNKVLNIENIDL